MFFRTQDGVKYHQCQKDRNIAILILAIILAGCNGGKTPSAVPVVVDTPAPVIPADTPVPTAVPPATRILVSTGNRLPEADIQEIMTSVQSLAGQSGLTVESSPA